MQRVTVTLEDDLLLALDALTRDRGWASRSEALRDLVRDALSVTAAAEPAAPSYGVLSYVYDHEVRDLARRLTHEQHEHHDLTIASLHVHLDHEACLETAVLRGAAGELRGLADRMVSRRGVKHGRLHLVPDSNTGRPSGLTLRGHGE